MNITATALLALAYTIVILALIWARLSFFKVQARESQAERTTLRPDSPYSYWMYLLLHI